MDPISVEDGNGVTSNIVKQATDSFIKTMGLSKKLLQ